MGKSSGPTCGPDRLLGRSCNKIMMTIIVLSKFLPISSFYFELRSRYKVVASSVARIRAVDLLGDVPAEVPVSDRLCDRLKRKKTQRQSTSRFKLFSL